MSWCPAPRNPVERDARVEQHGNELRVELYRGGRLQAVRTFSQVPAAVALIERWLLLGPAVFVLERPQERPSLVA
jgi:hypothetical protein